MWWEQHKKKQQQNKGNYQSKLIKLIKAKKSWGLLSQMSSGIWSRRRLMFPTNTQKILSNTQMKTLRIFEQLGCVFSNLSLLLLFERNRFWFLCVPLDYFHASALSCCGEIYKVMLPCKVFLIGQTQEPYQRLFNLKVWWGFCETTSHSPNYCERDRKQRCSVFLSAPMANNNRVLLTFSPLSTLYCGLRPPSVPVSTPPLIYVKICQLTSDLSPCSAPFLPMRAALHPLCHEADTQELYLL